MAINPDEINLVKYPDVPESVINANDIMTKSNDLGMVNRFKARDLVNYLLPRVTSGISSGYIPIFGFELPSPAGNNSYSWVGAGVYTLDGEIEFTAVKDLNQIYWNGSSWEIIQEIQVLDATTTVKGKVKLAGDLSGTADLPTVPGLVLKENVINKQNSLSTDGTGVKYPTVDAVNYGLDLKINKSESSIFNGIQFNNKNIHFFGDSYTSGSGATTTAQRWTTLMSKRLGAVEVNHGVAGTTMSKRVPINYMASPNMVDNLVNVPTKTENDALLVLAFGLNDMGYNGGNYTQENYETDYTTVLEYILSKGWDRKNILLITPYYLDQDGLDAYALETGRAAPTFAWHKSFVASTLKIGSLFNIACIDMYDAQERNNTTLFDPDHIHTNDVGMAFIANTVASYAAYKTIKDGSTVYVTGSAMTFEGNSSNRDITITNGSEVDNFSAINVQANTVSSDAGAAISIIPKGTGFSGSLRSQLGLFGTDYVTDPNNGDSFILKNTSTGYVIGAEKFGTGTLHPIKMQINGVDVAEITTLGKFTVANAPTNPTDVVRLEDIINYTFINSSGTAPTSTSLGKKGEIRYDGTYRYECVATDTWIRSLIEITW